MEVWRFKTCKICLGTGVKAAKKDYERWQGDFSKAMQLVNQGKPRSVFYRAKKRLEKILKSYPSCSFCDGEGGYGIREPDENT